jgi:hypothetical protein
LPGKRIPKPIISPSALSEAIRVAEAEKKDREAKTPSSKKKSWSSSSESPSAETSEDEEGDGAKKASKIATDVFKVIFTCQKDVTKPDVGYFNDGHHCSPLNRSNFRLLNEDSCSFIEKVQVWLLVEYPPSNQ